MSKYNLPKYIFINDFKYKLLTDSLDNMQHMEKTRAYLAGVTYSREQQIWLADDIKGDLLRHTLLHEIVHALFSSAGHDQDYSCDEQLVDFVATQMRNFCKDNPKLAKYVLGCEP